jgi:uncharacterized glyoxalase superfamily protein PhnB
MKTTVKELRLILTVDNLDELISFYRDTVGLETSKEWHEEAGNGIILEAGRASLELIDAKHADRIDQIEVGKRVSGSVRLALRVSEPIPVATETLVDGGATSVAPPTTAPWSEVSRVQAPDGMQITLFATSTLVDK